MKTPYIPLLYSKTGVYRDIHYFLIFSLKHRLWVLVSTEAVLTCTNDLCFRAKIRKYHKFSSKNNYCYIREILQYIVWACFRNGLKVGFTDMDVTLLLLVCIRFSSTIRRGFAPN